MDHAELKAGIRDGMPLVISASPFGALFGAVAVTHGQTIAEATLMSATMFAGASQLVGIELFGQDVEPWIIILSVFAVNFRHILYSAALASLIRHFSFTQKAVALFLITDPQFAETLKRADTGRKITPAWYLGFGGIIYIVWLLMTVLGGLLGKMISDPMKIGLDVLLPIYFMGLVLGFRKRDRFVPVVAVSAAASIAAFHWVGSPWHVSIGALAGICLAAVLPVPPQSTVEAEV